ncbi:hypothetical protein, partial [Bacillus paralicheniformis]|uniref:hypothetical protein n=1 Tax=Bacillus paralicheniformis TaxID=1648923 RepID=UPI002DB618D8
KKRQLPFGCYLHIVNKNPKRLLVLGFCHHFRVMENPGSLGRPRIGAERMLEFVSTNAQA